MQQSQSLENQIRYQDIFETVNDGLIVSDLKTGRIVEANPAAYKMHGYSREEFIGLPLQTFIHSDSQHDFNESVRTFQSDDIFDTRIQHICRDGSTFFAVWRGAFFTYQDQFCLLGIVRDVSKRIQAEQLLHQSIETRTHEQATLLEISHTLASTLELQPGLILDQLRKIIKYSHGALFALEGDTLIALAMRGTPELESLEPIRIHLNTAKMLTSLFNGHRPIRIENVWDENPQAKFLRSLLGAGSNALLEDMQSWMWVPLAVKGRIIGGVGVAHRNKNYFTPHHADLALSVANQAAITMINTELYKQAQDLAVLEERQRLARNLHDAVNQSLFSAGLIAEVLPRLWDRDQKEARKSLEALRRLIRGATAEMRALLAELLPSTLIDSDLSELLRLLGNAFTSKTNLPVTIVAPEGVVLPGRIQIAFYRICQEALNNISKHANAAEVKIRLVQKSDAVELHIRDDGLGFDTAQKAPSGHYGLKMMRERAEKVNAQLTITSKPGHGVKLILHWDNPSPQTSINTEETL